VKTRFGRFTLDSETRQLTEGAREIHLTPKAFDLLAALVSERPKVISKALLQDRLWPGSFVVEANVSNLVSEVRDALGDCARAPRFIRTAHGLGYAFCAQAITANYASPDSNRVLCWLEWGRHRFPLAAGDHMIGRDPDVAIALERSTVSRRHARLLVTAECTMLEDAGSKNGTFRGDARVTSPVPLTDGDAVRIGSLLLTYHATTGLMTTATDVRSAS
jgi:DNA-binding winged helix-turn-helix (wHTH) protein